MTGLIYTRITAHDGVAKDGDEEKPLEQVLNEMNDVNDAIIVSHQAVWATNEDGSKFLLEVVIMASPFKEAKML